MPIRLTSSDPGFHSAFSSFLVAKRDMENDVDIVVADILAEVRTRGDAAVIDYTKKFDRLGLVASTLRVTDQDVERAVAACEKDALAALQTAADRITAYHERMHPEDFEWTDEQGVQLGSRWRAVESAGLYVPGGLAAYPSSVLMNALPAKVAGVDRLVMVVPSPDGVLNHMVLAAAHFAGVDEIYRIGGAQAIGALAYGTDTIEPVDKIVGPGNAYVAAAKRRVFGIVGIDMIAGPSEILVVADAENDPDWMAVDLLSQAEHDTSAQSILITDNAKFADQVVEAVDRQLATLPRHDIARASWDNHGAVITVSSFDDAAHLVDQIAPEHLELAVADPRSFADKVRNAGAIFLGRHTPEAIGDYVAGPNHVLPTSRSARFSSGLGVLDFMKRTSLVSCNSDSLAKIGPAAVTLAGVEGLHAHARSIAIRLDLPIDEKS